MPEDWEEKPLDIKSPIAGKEEVIHDTYNNYVINARNWNKMLRHIQERMKKSDKNKITVDSAKWSNVEADLIEYVIKEEEVKTNLNIKTRNVMTVKQEIHREVV